MVPRQWPRGRVLGKGTLIAAVVVEGWARCCGSSIRQIGLSAQMCGRAPYFEAAIGCFCAACFNSRAAAKQTLALLPPVA
jgi:hypothetical protein